MIFLIVLLYLISMAMSIKLQSHHDFLDKCADVKCAAG